MSVNRCLLTVKNEKINVYISIIRKRHKDHPTYQVTHYDLSNKKSLYIVKSQMLNFKFNTSTGPNIQTIYTTEATKKTQSQFSSCNELQMHRKRQISIHQHGNIFKHVCVKGNTINKTNGTEGLDNLNWEAQCLVKYSQETKY